MVYVTVFLSALIAATILPMYSEAVLGTFILKGHQPFALWASATAGNTLGAIINWILGRYLLHWQNKRWFPVSRDGLDKATTRFNRYGLWSLLFAWLPIIGDPLTLVAGMLKVRLGLFILLVGLGKGLRYAVIVWIATTSA